MVLIKTWSDMIQVGKKTAKSNVLLSSMIKVSPSSKWVLNMIKSLNRIHNNTCRINKEPVTQYHHLRFPKLVNRDFSVIGITESKKQSDEPSHFTASSKDNI